MVRTKADAVTARLPGAKAPRKHMTGAASILHPNSNGDKNRGREHAGGNSYCPRETPEWQKPITSFFIRPPESGESAKRGEQMDLKDSDSVIGTSTSGGSTFKEDKTD